MKKSTVFIFLFFVYSAYAQHSNETYSRVQIALADRGIRPLATLGLDTDHGLHIGKYLIGEFSESELRQITTAGYTYKTLVHDLQATLKQQLVGNVQSRSNPICNSTPPSSGWATPINYTYGSMAQYHTLSELMNVLDDMKTKFPNLITQRAPVANILTHEGRQIYFAKISDNPNQDETDEPEVLFTALHHAREPNSMSQMLFFMWYLLEHYQAGDPEIVYLVNNTQIYFVPCINPDGYAFNEMTNPNGGGFWRKNRYIDTASGDIVGVDLNRNYGFEWGHDDIGSSPEPQSEVYRGPYGFSEPETQAIRDFCSAHDFRITLNYHTFSNLLINPWGWSDMPTPDSVQFNGIGEEMVHENNYIRGVATETVGYQVNGNSDDWMYGETILKPKIIAYTPEVGYSFWPNPADIDKLNKDCMHMNLTTLRLLHHYGVITANAPSATQVLEGYITYNLQRLGMKDGTFTVSLIPIHNVATIGASQQHTLQQFAQENGAINYTLLPTIATTDRIAKIGIVLNNGIASTIDTLTIRYGSNELILNDTIDFDSNWDINQMWNVTSEAYYSAPLSLTDSPFQEYENNANNSTQLLTPINLAETDNATLTFWTKWATEPSFDFVQVWASANGGVTRQALCGKYTKPGVVPQPLDEPIYDGFQNTWVQEEIDLSDFLGQPNVTIGFTIGSDEFQAEDGFYLDDIQVTQFVDGTVSTLTPDKNDFATYANPTPATDAVTIRYELQNHSSKDATLSVYTPTGQLVAQQPLSATSNKVVLQTQTWHSGMYLYTIKTAEGATAIGKICIIK